MSRRVLAALLLVFPTLLWSQLPAAWQSRGAGAGGALYSPAINPANDSEYFIACDMSELFHTTDFGNSYSVENFAQIQGGHFSAVQFTADTNILYNLNYTGDYVRPAKSIDGGRTWAVLAGNPLPWDSCYSLWADYDNPARVVVSGWAAVFISTNGGASFLSVNVALTNGTGALVGGAFFDGQNITLGTSEGVLVSTNGGASFINTKTPGIAAGEYIRSFAGAKAGSQTRFFCLTTASAYAGQDGGDYWSNLRGVYSLDNGATSWTRRMGGIDLNSDWLMFIAMARNDLNTAYAAGSKVSSAGNVPGVMKSVDGGLSWTNVFLTTHNRNIATGWSGEGGDRGWGYGEAVYGLAVAPTNSARAVFTDMGFAHRTSDGGATWQQAYVSPADQHPTNSTAIAHASYHSIGLEDTSSWQVFWSDPQNLFAGFSDIGGVRSTDAGVTWSFNYTGHAANTMYRAVIQPATRVIYAATSDIHDLYQSTRLADAQLDASDLNGKIIFSPDQGASWQTLHTFSHPVFWLDLDPNNPNRMYASVVHSTSGGLYVSANIQAGPNSTWTKLFGPPRTEGHPATVMVLNDGKVLCTFSGRRAPNFTASSGVFLYDPVAGIWSDRSDPGMIYWTKDIALDPTDPAQNTWYAGVFSGWGGPPNGLGGLYRTTDRGAHWTRINSLDRVTSITFNPASPGEAYLTTETSGLWRTTNAQAGVPAFALVANYPFRQPERVHFNPYDLNEIWITSFGNGLAVGRSAAPVQRLEFSAARYAAAETAGALTVIVARTGGSNGAVSVGFATANGTALSPANFSATNGTLTWPDGDASSRSFLVPIRATAGYAGNLSFGLTLSSPTGGAALGRCNAAGVLLETDPPPAATNYNLTVVNGAGSGTYGVGLTAAIAAAAPAAGYGFDQWTGAAVANPFATNTTLVMPAHDVTVTATYKWLAAGTNYEVGPGQPYPALSAVPWMALQPRDVINIHYQPGGYHEIVMLSNSGASGAPITLHGVPDPLTGALPTLDGSNAVAAANIPWRSTVFDGLGVIVISRALGTAWGYIPSWITLENLHIQNADRATPFTTSLGAATKYSSFATGIYVEFAQHLTLRNCEINGAENGFFCNSKDGTPLELSGDLLIERCWIHDNGYPGDYGVHNLYTEAMGITLQYNSIGPLRPGACGEQWKNRSAGTRVRYNQWIMSGPGTCMWLESPQGGQGVIDVDPSYKTNWCYGNLIFNPPTSTGNIMVRFDALGVEGQPRNGILYFYNNTVINYANQSQHWGVSIFELPHLDEVQATGIQDTLDCRNNIFASIPTTAGATPTALSLLMSDDGTINYGPNWVSPGAPLVALPYLKTNFYGTLTGTNLLLFGDAQGKNNPGFVDVAATNCHLLAASRCVDAAGPQAPAITGTCDDVTLEYLSPANCQPRVVTGAGLDLGAFEGNATNTTPAAGTLQFSTATAAVAETGAAVALTINRVGGTNGAVAVDFATIDGTAIAYINYFPTNGTLTWAAGDATPRSIRVPVIYEPVYRGDRTFTVQLSRPAGGATLGTPATALVTILETDSPPPNYPPLAYPQSASTVENVAVPITLMARDPDNDPLTFTMVTSPTKGTLSGTPPNLLFTPTTNATGPDFFLFTVSDRYATSAAAVVQIAINAPTSAPPAVVLSSPLHHAWFVAPTNLTLAANASAPDGISRIDFYAGTNILGTVSNAPFVFTWTNPAPGTYALFAKAFSNAKARTYSAPALISVVGAVPRLDLRRGLPAQTSLAWPLGLEGWFLQESTNLTGPWTLSRRLILDTPTNRSAVIAIDDRRFFRLALPQ